MTSSQQKKLLLEATHVKKQARRIIAETDIIKILVRYGEVKIAGSYALDVMVRPDLDLFIVVKKHNYKKFSRIFSKLISSGNFYEAAFANWVDFGLIPPFELQKGYYARVHRIVDGVKWKIDLWFITPEFDWSERYTDRFSRLLKKGRNDKRAAILKIKKDLYVPGKKYIPGVDGKLIYKAVLEHGIMTTDRFKKWCTKEGILL